MTTWVEKLLAWFKVNGRELPWREERTPYRTWVSEIMLQQTRVEAVRAYYTNWLEKFPTPETVAQASTEEVLHAWQGLGYYRRARLLQQAMQEVQAQYDGEIPSGRDELLALPGVGPYVMGAIRSLAFNEPEPAV
ncbi:MAG: A/G-specific adenine glycosylase, partial [Negativicoccus succinicivorans]|nr:A/G-specific adenine glycosylase [Negativicoccus succinicivorans]